LSREEFLAKAHIVEQQKVEIRPIEADGFILDIGGGGEGIIGRLNGRQVAAIDIRPSELEEAQNDALKIVMDATDLKFLDDTFAAATAFFTMMYVPDDDKPKVLSEAYRVLRPGGRLQIWDANIPGEIEGKVYFVIHLKVLMPGETVETGYGSPLRRQSAQTLWKMAEEAGFRTIREGSGEHIFYLELEK
jgi:ubiquinone/menaquinone biosynthesis C-methylase UbiE